MNRFCCLCLFVASLFLTTEPIALAQTSNKQKQDERKENERVARANLAVTDAKRDLVAVQKELKAEMESQTKAALTLQLLKKKLRETREEAEDRLGAKIGIPEALAKVRNAGASRELIASKIRDEIHKSTSWIQADQASQDAKKKKAALLDDVEELGKDNDQQLAQLAKWILLPIALEDEAIAKDSNAIDATKRLAEEQVELDKKRKLLPKGEVDRDKKVVQVLSEMDKQEKVLSDIESKLRKVKSEANKVQRRLADAAMNLQKAKAADAADPNRAKKNNGNKD